VACNGGHIATGDDTVTKVDGADTKHGAITSGFRSFADELGLDAGH
jgi:hypothetical protein